MPPEELIAAYHEHRPDAFGLSGLLVKSAQQMVVTAQDLTAAGIDIPLLVGGAALSQKFTATRIAPAYGGLTLYAKDAMHGLDLADQLFSGGHARGAASERVRARAGRARPARRRDDARPGRPRRAPRRRLCRASKAVRAPPDLERARPARPRRWPTSGRT